MTRVQRFLATSVAVLALLGAAPARADGGAQQFIQERQQKVSDILAKPAGTSRDKQVADVLDKMLDYDQLAKRSLAKDWDGLADDKRKEFTSLLRQLVQRNYEKNLKHITDYKVEWLGEEPGEGGDGVVVHTKATSKTDGRDEVTIDYRVHTMGAGLGVFDIVTEGSSLVGNYRNQFHRVIAKDGIDALLKRMRDKLAKGSGDV